MDGLNPITRKEMFLAAAGGQDVTTPTPITREEVFLDEIAKGGGSSLPSTETASAGDVLSLDDNKEPQWAAPGGGGGSGALVVTVGGLDFTLDKTWQEIFDAATAGVPIIIRDEPTETEVSYGYIFTSVSTSASTYTVQALFSSNTFTFTTDSADGYPVLNM